MGTTDSSVCDRYGTGPCPEQHTLNYTSGGPPDPEMMVTADELREHFSADGIEQLEVAEPILEEGMHQGPAATVQFVWRRGSN